MPKCRIFSARFASHDIKLTGTGGEPVNRCKARGPCARFAPFAQELIGGSSGTNVSSAKINGCRVPTGHPSIHRQLFAPNDSRK